jgi:oxygen-dependent protoporphyrinogen oxidase
MPAFIKMEREHGSLIAALQKKNGAPADSAVFTTLRSGLQTLVERMQSAMPVGSIRFRTTVNAVAQHEDRWRVDADGEAEFYDEVIVATPAHVTRKLLRPLDENIAGLLKMEATSAIVVAFGFSRDQSQRLRIPRGFGYLVPSTSPGPKSADADEAQLLACTFVDQKFTHRAPTGAVLLRAFFGGAAAEALNAEPDAYLISHAHRRLSEVLGPLPEPVIKLVRRWPLSLPQYEVGHLSRMKELAALTQTFPGLHLIGNAYYGVGLPDMVRQGREAARAISAIS